MQYNFVVGLHEENGVSVRTFWSSNGQYSTFVRSPLFKDGQEHWVASYGNDFAKARCGHSFWIERMAQTDTEIKNCNIKISLSALMKILYNYMGNDSVLIEPERINFKLLLIEIRQSGYQGCCRYDLSTMSIVSITKGWHRILEDQLEDALDRLVDKKLKENV